jgi:hypothetical protein
VVVANTKRLGPEGAGVIVALSDDDGETWKTRQLPGIVTAGYTTAAQAPNGVIHIVTSKNVPPEHIELNEAGVLEGGPELPEPAGQFRLEGKQTFKYPNGGSCGKSRISTAGRSDSKRGGPRTAPNSGSV